MLATQSSTSHFPTTIHYTAPSSPTRLRRPSISNAISWLHKSSSSVTSHHSFAPSKPIHISEPRLAGTEYTVLRKGPLGTGATVVRTPQEALAGIVPLPEDDDDDFLEGHRDSDTPSPPESPPLPPLPLSDELAPIILPAPRCPTRAIPPPPTQPLPSLPVSPTSSPQRPALKVGSSPQPDLFPPVPPMPEHVSTLLPTPPFEPVLLSDIPSNIHRIAPEKVLVSIETSESKFKTTLATLRSSPSFLAHYLSSLVAPTESDDSESLYSQIFEDRECRSEEQDRAEQPDDDAQSSFTSIFQRHLVSAGLIPRRTADVTAQINIFIDRPSAPYKHIMTYLRSLNAPSSSTTRPASLPFLRSTSAVLLELRDEALYLGLTDLYKLCHELIAAAGRQRIGHTRENSSESVRSTYAASALRGDRHSSASTQRPESTKVSVIASREGRSYSQTDPARASSSSSGLQLRLQARGRSKSKDRDAGGSVRARPTGDWI